MPILPAISASTRQGDVEVNARENAYLSAEAISVAASFSLGSAVGDSVVSNTADSDIEATITGADVTTFGDIDVLAESRLDIDHTDTAGISGSLVGREPQLGERRGEEHRQGRNPRG